MQSQQLEENDNDKLLNSRTTNVSVRVSPILKLKLMEKAANKGVNLSDYVFEALITHVTTQNSTAIVSKEYQQDLEEKCNYFKSKCETLTFQNTNLSNQNAELRQNWRTSDVLIFANRIYAIRLFLFILFCILIGYFSLSLHQGTFDVFEWQENKRQSFASTIFFVSTISAFIGLWHIKFEWE
jgi:hypothetical protein